MQIDTLFHSIQTLLATEYSHVTMVDGKYFSDTITDLILEALQTTSMMIQIHNFKKINRHIICLEGEQKSALRKAIYSLFKEHLSFAALKNPPKVLPTPSNPLQIPSSQEMPLLPSYIWNHIASYLTLEEAKLFATVSKMTANAARVSRASEAMSWLERFNITNPVFLLEPFGFDKEKFSTHPSGISTSTPYMLFCSQLLKLNQSFPFRKDSVSINAKNPFWVIQYLQTLYENTIDLGINFLYSFQPTYPKRMLRSIPPKNTPGRIAIIRDVFKKINDVSTGRMTLVLQQAPVLPKEFSELTNLSSLILSGKQLKKLPPEIGFFSHLECLIVYRTKITELPKEISRLVNLHELIFFENAIKTLPSEIGHLTKLKKLYVAYNQISSFPQEIYCLQSLTQCVLDENALEILPKEIGTLTNLEKLTIRHNRIKTLPFQIGSLINLVELNVDHNCLTLLPPDIGRLERLHTLIVSKNKLKELPKELFSLHQLRILDISRNPISLLSSRISNIRSLSILKLEKTNLQTIPIELFELKNIQGLTLERTLWTSLSPEQKSFFTRKKIFVIVSI